MRVQSLVGLAMITLFVGSCGDDELETPRTPPAVLHQQSGIYAEGSPDVDVTHVTTTPLGPRGDGWQYNYRLTLVNHLPRAVTLNVRLIWQDGAGNVVADHKAQGIVLNAESTDIYKGVGEITDTAARSASQLLLSWDWR